MNRTLATFGSARRLARQWVDLGDEKRKELLSTLDTESRIAVIENLIRIKIEEGRKNKNDI